MSPTEYLKKELGLTHKDIHDMSIQMLSQLVMMAEKEQSRLFAEDNKNDSN